MPHLLGKTTVTLPLTLTLNPNPDLDQDLTRAFCVLLKNCLTSPDLRERMVNDGAVRPLVQLLHKSEIRGAQRSPAVVAAAASAVWNISAHESAKVRSKPDPNPDPNPSPDPDPDPNPHPNRHPRRW